MSVHNCVRFDKVAGNLVITLLPEGREEIQNFRAYARRLAAGRSAWTAEDTISELFERQLCNGWDRVRPEDIGALTSCPYIFTDDCEMDDEGKITSVGRVYWFPRYEVDCLLEELEKNGSVTLQGVRPALGSINQPC